MQYNSTRRTNEFKRIVKIADKQNIYALNMINGLIR